jgi:hypothetical protein
VGGGVAGSLRCDSLSRRTASGPPAAVSVLLRGKRRFSGVDVEGARLLHRYTLHGASADARGTDYIERAATCCMALGGNDFMTPQSAPA